MSLTHEGNAGLFRKESSPDGAAIVLETTVAIPSGRLVLVRLATGDGDEAVSGATDQHLVSDEMLHAWTKIAEVTQIDLEGTNNRQGVTLSLWSLFTAAEIPMGTEITGSFTSQLARGMSIDFYDPGDGLSVTLLAVEAAFGSGTDATSPKTVTTEATAQEGDIDWLSAGAWDNGVPIFVPNGSPAAPAFWEFDVEPWAEADWANRRFGVNGWGLQRASESPTMTLTVEDPAAPVDGVRAWAQILAAFFVEPPEPEPPEPGPAGTREYKEEFETEDFGVDGTSTTRRPDAISWDYLTAYAPGPADIGDPGSGPDARRWRVVARPTAIILQRMNVDNNGWEPERLVHAYDGPPVLEISLAFDFRGYPVIVMERETGASDAPHVWILRKPS